MNDLLQSKLLAKLKDVQSLAISLISINDNKLKENEQKSETLKARIQEKTVQIFNSLFEQQVMLIEKTDTLEHDLKLRSNELMCDQKKSLDEIQEIEMKLNSICFSNPNEMNEMNQIQTETEQLETNLKDLKEKLNSNEFNYYFKSNYLAFNLGKVLVSNV